MKVCDRMCDTCIFSKRSPIDAERFESLERTWQKDEVAQLCHQHRTGSRVEPLTPDSVVCRGYYEAVKRGDYAAPAALQVSMRLGWVREVPAMKAGRKEDGNGRKDAQTAEPTGLGKRV